jgi:hypothetical protein
MAYPKPLIYFRQQTANLPANLTPANLDPGLLGVQISSVSTFQLSGTPSAQFALLGKGPQKSPTSSNGTVTTDNVWSLQGAEVRIYFDSRTNQSASFSSAGEANIPLVFCGNVHECRPTENSGTPWYAYTFEARGLIARAERVPVVSPIDNSDNVRFNINALLDDYQPTTGGKSVGDAIRMILTSYSVAYRLNQQGIGNFTLNDAAQTATLPSATESDLNNISLVPPFEFRISGDNVIAAIQETLDSYAPNFSVIIQPDGTIRFPDLRNHQPYNLDLISNIVDGLNYTKSTLGSYSRVLVRGGPKVVPYYCQWNIPRDNPAYNLDDSPDNSKFNGNMVEFFDYTGATNTQAKVNFQHANFTWGRILLSVGNVTFANATGANLPSNQIRIIPASGNLPGSNTTNLQNWLADELTMIDKGTASRREARVKINRNFWKIGTGGTANSIIRKDSGEFLITQNTQANASVNWSILTTNPNVDRPPNYNASTNYYTYDYELYGYTREGSTTWRRYTINLDAISNNNPLTTTQKGMARRIGNVFPTPVDGLNFSQIGNSNTSAGVNQQRKVWYPECLVEYRQRVANSTSASYTYQAFWAGFRINPVNNFIVLSRPSVQEVTGSNGTYTDKMPPWDTGTGNSTNQPFQIVPYNIKVLLPVYEGTQEAAYPHYDANMTPAAGESNATVKTRYGIERDLIVTLPEWYEARDQSSADQFAKDIWDSVEKPLIQGGFAWVDGIPSTEWSYAGVLSNGKLQSFNITANETCRANAGSGLEDCSLLMTACEIKFPGNRKPFTVASFTTARPRAGVPMHDFHSFNEMLERDPMII